MNSKVKRTFQESAGKLLYIKDKPIKKLSVVYYTTGVIVIETTKYCAYDLVFLRNAPAQAKPYCIVWNKQQKLLTSM